MSINAFYYNKLKTAQATIVISQLQILKVEIKMKKIIWESEILTEKNVSVSSSNLMNLSKQAICIKLLEWRNFGTVLKTAAATNSW